MRNILALFASDVRRLFTNSMSVIIAVGLVILPSIFAWYNIIAAWDVFGNTGNLTVAVASVDEGYKSDLVPIEINVGEQVVSALRANEDIDWVFTDEEDAIDGARAGRYYAAVVIPESFSRDMLTFYSDDAQHASIVYYANEKKNAVAPKITAQGADSVSYQVNQVFVETLSEIAVGLADGISTYLDDDSLTGNVADLADHMRSAADEMDRASQVMGMYVKLADSAQSLSSGSAQLIASTEKSLTDAAPAASSSVSSLTSLADTLKSSAGSLSDALGQSASGFSAVGESVDALFDTASADSALAATQMRNQATAATTQATQCRDAATALEGLVDSVPTEYQAALRALVARLNATADLMDAVAGNLNSAAGKLEAGNADVQQERAAVKQSAAEAQASINAARADFDANVKPGLEQLASEASGLAGNIQSSTGRLQSLSSDLSGAVGSVGNSVGDASTKMNLAIQDLGSVSEQLRELADKIDEALATGDSEQLKKILGSDTEALANALSAPVGVERHALYPTENFGSAMAPLYTTLALFIGALLIMVALRPEPSSRAVARLNDPKPRQLFLGHFGVVATLSLAQSTLMGLGNIFFVEVQVSHPLLFMLCYWVSGLVFAFIVYALVVSFANLGKAVAVLLLIVQVTGCGGSFPLPILPSFISAISPFLPATHVVNAMRAAMFGTYGNDFWVSMGILLLFVVPFALLGLMLRKPLERFMKWYVEQVESSKVVG